MGLYTGSIEERKHAEQQPTTAKSSDKPCSCRRHAANRRAVVDDEGSAGARKCHRSTRQPDDASLTNGVKSNASTMMATISLCCVCVCVARAGGCCCCLLLTIILYVMFVGQSRTLCLSGVFARDSTSKTSTSQRPHFVSIALEGACIPCLPQNSKQPSLPLPVSSSQARPSTAWVYHRSSVDIFVNCPHGCSVPPFNSIV